VARPKDRSIDVNGPGGDDGAPPAAPSHRAVRLLALGALVLIVGGYVVMSSYQHQNPERSVDAYCAQVGAVVSLDDALGDLDAGAVQDAFTQLTQLEQVTPNDIDPQLRTVIEAIRPLVETLQTSSTDDEQAARQVLLAHQADAARVDAAAHAVDEYTSTTCHRELDTTLPDTTPTTAPSTSTTAFAPPRPTTSTTRKAVPPPSSSSSTPPTTATVKAPTTTASGSRPASR
jgi:hypothetical protein